MFSTYKIILPACLILASCSSGKHSVASVQNNDDAEPKRDPKQIEATVIDFRKVDGCGFLLELASRERLQPENLPVEFEKDKMKVMIKYHFIKKMSVCMAGKTVYLDFIKAQNE